MTKILTSTSLLLHLWWGNEGTQRQSNLSSQNCLSHKYHTRPTPTISATHHCGRCRAERTATQPRSFWWPSPWFTWASLVAQRRPGPVPGSERSPREENGNPLQHSCWRIPWTEEPGGLQSTGLQSVGHDWVTNTHTHTSNLIQAKQVEITKKFKAV